MIRTLSMKRNFLALNRRLLSTTKDSLMDILKLVRDGALDPEEASRRIQSIPNDDVLASFAKLDYDRTSRVGFPEAVFAENKTVEQVAAILDSMAKNAAEKAANPQAIPPTAILATRVEPTMYEGLANHNFQHGQIQYHDKARIVSMRANNIDITPPKLNKRCVVVTAGTTDIPVAEEAAVTLELSGCDVDRVYDAGVAGLHRILRALPILSHESVGTVIVAAGMDGALPSVVGGLVSVPVVAVPTSIGYGASFGGISAMLTMMNSCSPGVAVVNIDNGFGAAALAFKCIKNN